MCKWSTNNTRIQTLQLSSLWTQLFCSLHVVSFIAHRRFYNCHELVKCLVNHFRKWWTLIAVLLLCQSSLKSGNIWIMLSLPRQILNGRTNLLICMLTVNYNHQNYSKAKIIVCIGSWTRVIRRLTTKTNRITNLHSIANLNLKPI